MLINLVFWVVLLINYILSLEWIKKKTGRIVTKRRLSIKLLKPDHLYYYHYVSSTSPEVLNAFSELQEKIIFHTIYIQDDSEFGWSIYLGSQGLENFPRQNESINILINGIIHFKLQIANEHISLVGM